MQQLAAACANFGHRAHNQAGSRRREAVAAARQGRIREEFGCCLEGHLQQGTGGAVNA